MRTVPASPPPLPGRPASVPPIQAARISRRKDPACYATLGASRLPPFLQRNHMRCLRVAALRALDDIRLGPMPAAPANRPASGTPRFLSVAHVKILQRNQGNAQRRGNRHAAPVAGRGVGASPAAGGGPAPSAWLSRTPQDRSGGRMHGLRRAPAVALVSSREAPRSAGTGAITLAPAGRTRDHAYLRSFAPRRGVVSCFMETACPTRGNPIVCPEKASYIE